MRLVDPRFRGFAAAGLSARVDSRASWRCAISSYGRSPVSGELWRLRLVTPGDRRFSAAGVLTRRVILGHPLSPGWRRSLAFLREVAKVDLRACGVSRALSREVACSSVDPRAGGVEAVIFSRTAVAAG